MHFFRGYIEPLSAVHASHAYDALAPPACLSTQVFVQAETYLYVHLAQSHPLYTREKRER